MIEHRQLSSGRHSWRALLGCSHERFASRPQRRAEKGEVLQQKARIRRLRVKPRGREEKAQRICKCERHAKAAKRRQERLQRPNGDQYAERDFDDADEVRTHLPVEDVINPEEADALGHHRLDPIRLLRREFVEAEDNEEKDEAVTQDECACLLQTPSLFYRTQCHGESIYVCVAHTDGAKVLPVKQGATMSTLRTANLL